MIPTHHAPILAFHCREELPAGQSLRLKYSGRWDRCCGPSVSSSKQQSSQTTTSTSGGTSPVLSGAGAQQIDSSSPVYNAVGSGRISIDSSPQVTQQAFQTISDLVGKALSSLGTTATTTAQTVQAQGNNQNDLLGAVLAQDQATAANQASGGQTNQNSTILWVIGIVAAVILGIFALPRLFKSS